MEQGWSGHRRGTSSARVPGDSLTGGGGGRAGRESTRYPSRIAARRTAEGLLPTGAQLAPSPAPLPPVQVHPGMPVGEFLAAAEPLVSPLDAYFDKVFVMCEDEAVRRGRLALMRELAALPAGILDLAQLPGF